MEKEAKTKAPRPRKKRIDSQQEKAKIVQGAHLKLEPPESVPLTERGRHFFDEILQEQAKSQWTRHNLTFAAQLADTMDRLEDMKREVDERGYLIDNERETRSGSVAVTTVKNPLLGEVARLTTMIVSMRRSLALHARGQLGDNRQAGKNREAARELEDQAQQDDDLIPGLGARAH